MQKKTTNSIKITVEEYLSLERKEVNSKSEYVDGIVYGMVGVSIPHITICDNITALLRTVFKNSDCKSYSSDLKVQSRGNYYYPDIVIICEKPEFYDDKQDIVKNPKVIFEILSSSTERFDRTRKFYDYRHNNTLTDYILISQDE